MGKSGFFFSLLQSKTPAQRVAILQQGADLSFCPNESTGQWQGTHRRAHTMGEWPKRTPESSGWS